MCEGEEDVRGRKMYEREKYEGEAVCEGWGGGR